MSQWYAIRINASRERQVAASLAERRITFFLPMRTDWAGQPRVRHMSPLLPGYVFVLGDDDTIAVLHEFEDVSGPVRYMRDDGNLWPYVFPLAAVIGLQADERAGLFDYTRSIKPPKYRPKAGARVKIKAGPYLGFFAKVLAATAEDRRRVRIEGDFDSPRHKTLDVAHLEAA